MEDKVLKKFICFEKLAMWMIIFCIIFLSFIQYSSYIYSGELWTFFESKGEKISNIMYFSKQTEDMKINQIIEALDSDFTQERDKCYGNNIWIKFKLSNNEKEVKNLLYIDNQIVKVNYAYVFIERKLVKLYSNEDYIYSYIKLPNNIDTGQFVYLNFDNQVNFNLRLTEANDFYKFQNQQFAFRMSNIAIILVMVIINIVFYITSKEKKYLVHFLLLFSLMNLLFIISGIQKIIMGFYDLHTADLWSFITIIAAMYFVYYYFDIKKITPKVGLVFETLISLNFLALILTQIFDVFIFKTVLWLHFVSICVLGLIVSIFTYLKMNHLTRPYFITMLLLSLSWALCTMDYYGIVESNIITSELVYLISSIEAMLFTSGIFHQIKSEKEKVQNLQIEVWTDNLTKVFNRAYFEKVVIKKVMESDQKQEKTSLLMVDIDKFKNINDIYGHNIGDIVLIELGKVITNIVRKEDVLIRWGGEEFILVLFNTNLNCASLIAEKIRSMIEEHEFSEVKKISVSIGVAQKHIDDTIEDWIKKADNAMYKAKREGRNRVEISYINLSPIKIDWSNVFECNNTQINDEHKELICMMNNLIEKFFSNYQEKIFITMYDKILDHTVSHFLNEENILEKSEYPHLDIHKKIHQEIVKEALEVRELLLSSEKGPSEVIEFLIGKVIVGHMISDDINYFKYL